MPTLSLVEALADVPGARSPHGRRFPLLPALSLLTLGLRLGYHSLSAVLENCLGCVRDVALREDACRVRSGNAPQVLAALRNAAVHLISGVAAARGRWRESVCPATRRALQCYVGNRPATAPQRRDTQIALVSGVRQPPGNGLALRPSSASSASRARPSTASPSSSLFARPVKRPGPWPGNAPEAGPARPAMTC